MNRLHSAAYRLGVVLLATAALLVGLVQLGPASHAQTKSAQAPDLALVPADATAFVHIRFADLWKSPLVQLFKQSAPGELAKAEIEMEKETGLKLTDLETATLIVLGIRGDEGEPPALGVISTSKPYDQKKIISAMKGDVQVQKVGNKPYHVAGGTALHFAGDRLIVAGGEATVKRFLESSPKPAPGKLAPALKLAGENHHIVAGFQIPEQFQQMAQQAPLPPDVEFMKPLAETHSGSIVLDLTNDIRLQVTLSLPSEAKAKQGVLAVQKGLEMARQMLTQMPPAGAEAPNWALMVNPLVAMLKSAKAEAQQANVVITMQASGAALIAASLPAVQKIRAAASRMEGANNLKQIGLAFHNYTDDHKQFPPQAITGKDGKPLLSWRVALLPYLDAPDLYKQFKLDEPWDGPNNKKLLGKIPKAYVHPSAKVKDPTHTVYQAFAGKGTLFEPGQKLFFTKVTDGTSNTILAAEAAEGVPWTKPEDMPYDPKKPLPKLGGHSEGGFFVLWCDGSTNFIKQKFDEATFRLAITRDDGHPIDRSLIEGP